MILRVIVFPTSVYSCSLQRWNTFQNKELTKLRNYISTYCFVFISKVIIMWIFVRLISLMCIIIFMVKHLQKCWIPWCTISQVKKKTDVFLVYGPLDQAVNLEEWLNIIRKYIPEYTDLCNIVIYLFNTIQHFIISTERLDLSFLMVQGTYGNL